MLSKAQAIHRELGNGVVDGSLPKPKGMHWKTYWRKVDAMEATHYASLLGTAKRFGIEL